MAEWLQLFGVPIMRNLTDTCYKYLQDHVICKTDMKEELERLQKIHPKIQAVVCASSQTQIGDQNPALNKWLWQLRDAIDEADDLLDEFEYMKHKQQLARNMKQRKVRSVMKSIKKRIVKIAKRSLKIDPNLKRLEEVVQKLDQVSAEVGTFLHLLESTKQEQQEQQLELHKSRETGSLPRNDLIGRGKDKEFVMQWLRKPSNEVRQTHVTGTNLYSNISLLSIVGHGGMGKTTLLQHVYEDEMTKEFDLKMWVCVSNNFDAKKIIAGMLEYIKKERPHVESIGALQESLKSEVKSKKFLLMLDDIWEEEEEKDKRKWENVFAPLAYGCSGSKILVTTRMDSVASMIANVIKKKKEILRLEGLEEDECLQLLNNHAFADVENLNDHKKLRSITGEMVKKLSGSPLAAKVMGGVLNSSLDERHWIKVLNNDIRSVKLGQNNILSILRLSYIYLPKPLQNCFAFCCIFEQDYQFDKDDLVQMWIALGFISQSDIQEETMEDIGGRYFDILVKKSFFDKIEYGSHYKMHDLLHELAQSISAQECFRVVGDEELSSGIPETIRHLSVQIGNIEVLRKMRKFKNLRSLFLSYEGNNQDLVDILTEIFKTSRSTRLLYISAPLLKIIPEAIGYLIHIRYFKIDGAYLTKLPRSLSNLYHLQFIIYNDSYFFQRTFPNDFLPRDMNNLSKLHYLELPRNNFSWMHGIGKIKSLQEMYEFYVKNEIGYRIEELRHMNELRKLRIKRMENVKDAEEAYNAKLCDKRNLMNLSLEWCESNGNRNNADPDLDEKVLDNFQPCNNLKKLSIKAYIGARSAIWMNKAHLISNLECIKLNDCLEWQTLPPFGQLPFLKSLHLYNMPKVKCIENKFHGNDKDYVFPSLEVLYINQLEALEDWFDATATVAVHDYFFPCLTKLYLRDCPKLQELPYLPPKLKIIEIDNIGWKTLNCCSISKYIPLETLKVLRCPNITYICLAGEKGGHAVLRNVKILNCPNLIPLEGHQDVETTENCPLVLGKLCINDPSMLLIEPLRSIIYLQKLTIRDNDELISIPIEAEQWFLKISSSICKLMFCSLKSLQSLPSSLENLSSLRILRVINVPLLQVLPNMPESLVLLELNYLESLQCLPSSLSTISSLCNLQLNSIPLPELPDLPPSLFVLSLENLNNLYCLPSCLPCLFFLTNLIITNVPQLQQLPDLPPSLCGLYLENLNNLCCLPSCLPSLSSLQTLHIENVPQLQELPDLSPSLESLTIIKCHLKLMERYEKFSGCDWHKIAQIPVVHILTNKTDLNPELEPNMFLRKWK